MAKEKIVLALDAGALILAEKDARVEAIVRKWLSQGAYLMIPAPAIAEAIRGTARDAPANRIIRAVDNVIGTTELTSRHAGALLGRRAHAGTVDALIAATAREHHATDILTTDPRDMRSLCGEEINVIAL